MRMMIAAMLFAIPIALLSLMSLSCGSQSTEPYSREGTILQRVRMDNTSLGPSITVYRSVRTGKCYLASHNEGMLEVGPEECR